MRRLRRVLMRQLRGRGARHHRPQQCFAIVLQDQDFVYACLLPCWLAEKSLIVVLEARKGKIDLQQRERDIWVRCVAADKTGWLLEPTGALRPRLTRAAEGKLAEGPIALLVLSHGTLLLSEKRSLQRLNISYFSLIITKGAIY